MLGMPGHTQICGSYTSGCDTCVAACCCEFGSAARQAAVELWNLCCRYCAALQKLLAMGVSVHLGATGATLTGATALHLAVHAGHVSIVKLLLAAGARVDQGDEEAATALHWSARKGCETTLALLLKSPTMAIDATDAVFDQTPLHWAVSADQGRAVEMLLAAGADSILKDTDGSTPLQMAADYGQLSALEVLMQHSTAAALVAAACGCAAMAHSVATLDAATKQAVLYQLARKAADLGPAATAKAASAHMDQQDLVQILQALGDAGTAKDQALAAAEVTNIQQERAAVQHLIVSMAGVGKQAQADLAQLRQHRAG